jgi:hypothetical protein
MTDISKVCAAETGRTGKNSVNGPFYFGRPVGSAQFVFDDPRAQTESSRLRRGQERVVSTAAVVFRQCP